MSVVDCLPLELQGPATTITRIAAGLSGAEVYRVEAADKALVLKIAAASEPAEDWRRALHIQRQAAEAGLTPRIVHVDETRRAVLCEFVADHSFPLFYRDPRTHQAALTLLGKTTRRIHALPIPKDAPLYDPREFLRRTSQGVLSSFAIPPFVSEVIRRMLDTDPPTHERSPVLSHNDLNPSNLVYDGETIQVLDWAAAGAMDPLFDLAVLSLFLRMDADTSQRLISAYDDRPLAVLSDGFVYTRRLSGALAGTMGLHLAQNLQHAGATGQETLESTLSLGDFYLQMRTGALKLGTAEGQWAFGLSLIKESLTL